MSRPDLNAIAQLRAQLWANGFRPVALHTGEKRPFGPAWQDRALGSKGSQRVLALPGARGIVGKAP